MATPAERAQFAINDIRTEPTWDLEGERVINRAAYILLDVQGDDEAARWLLFHREIAGDDEFLQADAFDVKRIMARHLEGC